MLQTILVFFARTVLTEHAGLNVSDGLPTQFESLTHEQDPIEFGGQIEKDIVNQTAGLNRNALRKSDYLSPDATLPFVQNSTFQQQERANIDEADQVTSQTNCRDQHINCKFWADNGECDKNPGYMLYFCPVSCNQCGTTCKDDYFNCKQRAQNSECMFSEQDMLAHCPVSCNQCGIACQDLRSDCYHLAQKGQCGSSYMSRYCPVSCNQCAGVTCTDKHTSCSYWAGIGECDKNPVYMLPFCPVSCTVCGVSCRDTNQSCRFWASIGECQKNPGYMLHWCPTSCNSCPSVCSRCESFS